MNVNYLRIYFVSILLCSFSEATNEGRTAQCEMLVEVTKTADLPLGKRYEP